jgi:hypothetical protein
VERHAHCCGRWGIDERVHLEEASPRPSRHGCTCGRGRARKRLRHDIGNGNWRDGWSCPQSDRRPVELSTGCRGQTASDGDASTISAAEITKPHERWMALINGGTRPVICVKLVRPNLLGAPATYFYMFYFDNGVADSYSKARSVRSAR